MILILHFKEEVSPKCIKPSCCFVLFLCRVHLRSPVKENKRKRRRHSQSVYRPGQEQKAVDFELEELKRQLELKAMNPLTVSQSSVNSVKAEQADVSVKIEQMDVSAKAEQPAQQSSASFFVSKESAPQSSASSVDADASVPFSALLSQSSQSQSSSQTGVSANQPMNDLQSIISSQSSIGNLQQPMQSQQQPMQSQQQSMELQQSQQQQSLESQQSSMESQTQQQSQQEQQPLIITPQTQAAERPATPQEPIDTCNASSRPQS